MDVVFQCNHCGQGLVADVAGKGRIISCPKCDRAVIIPDPDSFTQPAPDPVEGIKPSATATRPGSPVTRRTVIRLPSPGTEEEKAKEADAKKTAEADVEAAAEEIANWHVLTVIVGWICVVVGVLLAVLVPRAIMAYLPFFLGAFMMGIMLLVSGRVLHGIVLLLCTCVPPPLLMRTSIWDHIAPARPARPAASSAQQKLLIDASGKTKLVFEQESAAPAVQPAAPRSTEKIMLPPRKKKDRPSRPESDLAAPTNADGTVKQPEKPKDPYADLLSNAEEIPPLVPEDVLAQSVPVRSADFRWQEGSTAALSPDDPAPVADMPFAIYTEGGAANPPFFNTGRMGNDRALTIDENWDSEPHSGKTCMKVSYADTVDWAQAVWQHPPNNWGDVPGGHDLSKAVKLSFWARGDAGGERVELGVGMSQSANAVAHDTFKASSTFRLQTKWKKYSIPIEKYDRTRIISGLILRIEGQEKPIVFYLDDIQYEP